MVGFLRLHSMATFLREEERHNEHDRRSYRRVEGGQRMTDKSALLFTLDWGKSKYVPKSNTKIRKKRKKAEKLARRRNRK